MYHVPPAIHIPHNTTHIYMFLSQSSSKALDDLVISEVYTKYDIDMICHLTQRDPLKSDNELRNKFVWKIVVRKEIYNMNESG